jgi:putative membrane protein
MTLIAQRWNQRRNPAQGRLMVAVAGVLAAGLLVGTGPANAQQPGTMPGGAQQQQQQLPGATAAPGMTPGSGMPGTTNNQQSFSDAAFVHDALENNVTQVEMSQLVQTRSQSPDVQQFGQKMVQIHTELSNQLKPAAQQLGVREPKGPSKKEKQEIAKLQALSGPNFDAAYLTDLAKVQQKNLKAFKDEENNAQSAGLQQAAKADEPILAQHYEILEKLAQAHNVTIAEAK